MHGKMEVYLDGGVRKGTDVLKALALGARAVFVGRPVLWGLACKVCALLLAVICYVTGVLGRRGSERGVATTEGGVPSSNGTVRMQQCIQYH